MEYVWKKRAAETLVSRETVRKIRIGVAVSHVAVVILPLALATVLAWFPDREERITVMLYDPSLDNVVENPSPKPASDNPVPPSGTPDAGPAASPQPAPQPKVNTHLPRTVNVYRPTRIAQPKIKPMVRKPATPRTRPKPAEPAQLTAEPDRPAATDPRRRVDDITPVRPGAAESAETGSARNRGPRGSNSEAGHSAPGGQRGNSGYEIQIALMIERMWVTPESVRLGGREPRVLIELHIDPAGRVTGKRIKTRSGVLAMDESVAALLDSLHRVKPPFDGKAHTLTFWLKAKRD